MITDMKIYLKTKNDQGSLGESIVMTIYCTYREIYKMIPQCEIYAMSTRNIQELLHLNSR